MQPPPNPRNFVPWLKAAICSLMLATGSWATSRPQVQNILNNPDSATQAALNWDWCSDESFNAFGLESPWATVVKGVNLSQSLCSDFKGTWELYDRNLTIADKNAQALGKLTQEIGQPYFALYNPYTGILRTFLWVGPDANASTTGDVFLVKAFVTSDNTSAHPTHLMDFHADSTFPTLGQPAVAIEKEWFIRGPENNCWIAVDLFLTYDPADYLGYDGYEKQLFIRYEVGIQNTMSIQLNGSLTLSSSSSATSGSTLQSYMTTGRQIVSITKDGVQSLVQEYGSASDLGANLAADLKDKKYGSNAKLNSALAWVSRKLQNNDSRVGMVAALVPAVSTFNSIKNLLFSESTSSIQHYQGILDLSGSINDNNSTISYQVPYSGSILGNVPLYAYRHPAPASRKLGLFNFVRQPYANQTLRDTALEPPIQLLRYNPATPSRVMECANGLALTKDTTIISAIIGPYLYTKNVQRAAGIQVGLSFADPANLSNLHRRLDLAIVLGRTVVDSTTWHSSTAQLEALAYRMADLDALIPHQFAVGASHFLTLNDRVVVTEGGGHYANALSLGGAMLGAQTRTHELWVKDQAELRERARVDSVLVVGSLSQQNAASSILPALQLTSAQVTFPQLYVPAITLLSSGNNYLVNEPSAHLESGGRCITYDLAKRPAQAAPQCTAGNGSGQLVLAPGFYSNVVVYAGQSLVLQSGNYFIGNLQMESGSSFHLASSGSATQIFVTREMTWRPDTTTADPSRLLLLYLRKQSILNLETSFNGSVISPYSKVIMGQISPARYYGQFLAYILEVHQSSQVYPVYFNRNPEVIYAMY